MNRDRVSLAQILERIELAFEFAGKDKSRFAGAVLNQEAVFRQLEVIGEATKRVSPATRARSSEVPWKSMIGFKNVAVHQYDAIDLDRVWQIVQEDLPPIKKGIKSALRELPEE